MSTEEENSGLPVKRQKCTTRGLQAIWTNILKREFDYCVNWDNIAIPPRHPDYDWLIVVPSDISTRAIVDACAYDWHINAPAHLRAALTNGCFVDDRPRELDYAVWIRASMSADRQFMGTTTAKLKAREIRGITLAERLLLEFFVMDTLHHHLDQGTWTLCSGTQDTYNDDQVVTPTVHWDRVRDELTIGMLPENDSYEWCGTRQTYRWVSQ